MATKYISDANAKQQKSVFICTHNTVNIHPCIHADPVPAQWLFGVLVSRRQQVEFCISKATAKKQKQQFLANAQLTEYLMSLHGVDTIAGKFYKNNSYNLKNYCIVIV